jgi:hypothetical protein
MEAWDNDGVDINRTMNRIIYGVLHHPAQRDMGEDGARDCRGIMFRSVEQWWSQKGQREKDDYRRKLSRNGVERGENHKEGVHDTGHGCGKPLGMHKQFGGPGGNSLEDKIATAATDAILGGVTSGISNIVESKTGMHMPTYNSQKIDYGSGNNSGGGGGGFGGLGELLGGGHHSGGGGGLSNLLGGGHHSGGGGGGVGGILGAVAGGLLGGEFKKEETSTYQSSGRTNDGGYSQTTTEYGHHGSRYGQAEYTETQYPGGGQQTEYRRYEQDENSGGRHHGRQERQEPQGYGYEERTESRPTYGGGYEERTERRWEDNQGEYRREEETSSWGGGGGGRHHQQREDEGNSWERREERRDEDNSGGGGLFGGAGGGILGELARTAEETFREQNENNGERRGWGF